MGSFQIGRVSLEWAECWRPDEFRWRAGRAQAGRPDWGGSTARLKLIRPVIPTFSFRWLKVRLAPAFPGDGNGVDAKVKVWSSSQETMGRKGRPQAGRECM